MRLIMALADRANNTSTTRQPWKLRKDPARAAELQDVCTVALNLFRQLVVYLSPVLPSLARADRRAAWPADRALGRRRSSRWSARRSTPFTHMMKRVEPSRSKP